MTKEQMPNKDVLDVQGINAKGYGIIPKLVMQDKRLKPQAKAIYAYFCSYAGAGSTAFPSRGKILYDLGFSDKTYYKNLEQLKEFGYIKVEQSKSNDGKFQRNIFTIAHTVPCSKNAVTENLPCSKNPCTVDYHTNNNSININNDFNNISQSCLSSKEDGQGMADDTTQKIEDYEKLIKDNVGYGDLLQSHPHDYRLIDEFVAIILDVVVSDGKYIQVNGENKPRELVKRNLLRLDYNHMEHALDQFKSVTDRISKKKHYIITLLYNCSLELDLHYTNLVKHDQWN